MQRLDEKRCDRRLCRSTKSVRKPATADMPAYVFDIVILSARASSSLNASVFKYEKDNVRNRISKSCDGNSRTPADTRMNQSGRVTIKINKTILSSTKQDWPHKKCFIVLHSGAR